MNHQNSEFSNQVLLNRLIARYLEMEQAGRTANRDEILDWHPELADELQSFFANHDQMTGANAPGADMDSPTISPAQTGLDDSTILPNNLLSQARTIPPTTLSPGKEPIVPPNPASTEDVTFLTTQNSLSATGRTGKKVRYIGDYELIEEIARGGMGVVYKARQVKLNRLVALKMILAGQLAGEEDVKRFHAEAEAAASLDHPGIVPIYEIGEHDGQHYFSMAFVEGESLAAKVADGPLPPEEAAELTRKISQTMAYAHDNGVIHRDLKPANVLLDMNGEPKVTDFGLAKRLATDDHLTGTGQILGTPPYMPPEQAASETDKIGPHSDVYSVGAILYCLLTGRPPFQAATPMDTLLQVLDKEPVSPREINAKIPKDLETICLKCLEKSPSQRYPSAALGEELARFQRGEPIKARPLGPVVRSVRWAKRNRVVSALLGLVLLVFAGGTLISISLAVFANRRANAEARERFRAEGMLYANHIASAHRELQSQNFEKAGEHLDDCSSEFRGWEHHYLSTLVNTLVGKRRMLDANLGTVWTVAFSPDGTRVLSGGGAAYNEPGVLKLWDAQSGRDLFTLKGHEGMVSSVAFSPDGKRIVSGSRGSNRGTLRLWDAQSGQEKLTLSGHIGDVTSVAFSPDGKRIVSSGGKMVKVWDAQSGQEKLTLLGHVGGVTSVAFSPDGKRIVSGGDDSPFRGTSSVKVWDAQTCQETLTLKGHTDRVHSVAFSPDGKQIASGSEDKTVIVWNAQTGQVTRTFREHGASVNSVAFSPDGKRIVSGSDDKTVIAWNAQTGQVTLRFEGHTASVNSVAFGPDGKRIVSGSSDETVRIWEMPLGQDIFALKGHTDLVTGLAFSPDGKWIASASQDATLRVWDAEMRREFLNWKGHRPGVASLAFSPDGRRFASGGGKWDFLGLKGVSSLDKQKPGEIKLWDVETGRNLLSFNGHNGAVISIAFIFDGARIVSGDVNGALKLWDVKNGQEVRTLSGHTDAVTSVLFSPDGKRIVSGSLDATLRVWDAKTGGRLLVRKEHRDGVTSLAFSPDGKWIVTGSRDETLKLWDAKSVLPIQTLRGHSGAVTSVAFSPNSKRIVSGGLDSTLRVWRTEKGDELLTLRGQGGAISNIAFSPDGKRIVTANRDTTINVW